MQRCPKSVPAPKYKITCNPLKGLFKFQRSSDQYVTPSLLNYTEQFVSNTLNILSQLNEIKPKSLKLFTLFIF